jgi:FkbM family methyltransferase
MTSKSTRQFYLEAAALMLLDRVQQGRRHTAAPRVFVSNDLLGSEILVRGVYEWDQLEILFSTLFPGKPGELRDALALDVGGNIGNHALFFARHFAKVITFEPNPIVYDVLRANLLLNKADHVLALPVGLSDADQSAEFSQLEEENLGSSGLSRHVRLDATKPAINFPVQLRVGDDIVRKHSNGVPIALIKIDVEGHEAWVLRGLRETLKREHPGVVFESKHRDGEDGGAVAMALLKECGYTHFYVAAPHIPAVCRLPRPFGTIGGLITRLLKGIEYEINLIHEIEDRQYNMIMAVAC